MTSEVEIVGERLESLRARIVGAGGVGVKVLAVTKGFGPDALQTAVDVGLTMVGENYAQELLAKVSPTLSSQISVHFIGRLQSNKVGALARVVDVWQSIDRTSVLDAVAAKAPGAVVFIQVNVSGEPQKGGCSRADVDALVERGRVAGLDVAGLMTVGPADDPAALTEGFGWLRRTVDRLNLQECSMGMSDDLEIAVGEGATMVRVGSALFGNRPISARP